MNITSYAQNFEDVMLWRALRHVPNGFYIDVGAQHPVVDSVSKAFYEHGWRGIHVEATTTYANLLRQDRPDETVLQTALSDHHGALTFYEIPDTGLSTGDKSIAEKHQAQGFAVRETTVPCITLADVFAQAGQREIHWLKIDVEGMEPQVLAGWGDSVTRPWVLVVESTYPNSQIETHAAWQAMVLDRGYREVHFDGLSRFYVVAERTDIAERFNAPPNIFDGFALASTAPYNAPIRALIKQTEQQHKNALAHEQALNQQLQAGQQELRHPERERAQREKELAEQINQARQAREVLLRTLAQREQEVTAQLLALQQQAAQEKAEQEHRHREQEDALRREHAAREQALALQLQGGQQELRSMEQKHAEQTRLARQELETLLRGLAQREQQVAAQLLALQQQAEQEKAEQARQHNDQERTLHREYAEREKAFTRQLQAGQQELRRLEQERMQREKKHAEHTNQARQAREVLLRTMAQREQEVTAQLLALQQQAAQEKAEQERRHQDQENALRHEHAEREQALVLQLQASQQELHRLEQELVQREQALAEQASQARREQEVLLHTLAQREQEKADQAAAHRAQEQALTQQLQAGREELCRVEQEWAQQGDAWSYEVTALQGEIQALQEARQSQAQLHGVELSTQQDELNRLLQLQTELEAQMQAERHTSIRLRQTLAEVQHALDVTQASFSWRMTAPLRKLVSLVSLCKNLDPASSVMGKAEPPCAQISDTAEIAPSLTAIVFPSIAAEAKSTIDTEATPVPVQQETVESHMTYSIAASTPTSPVVVITLNELLASNDQRFVYRAYQKILGRTPDPEGLSYYLERLRSGFSKIEILKQLRRSPEGEAHAAHIPGLDAAIRRHKRAQHPLFGWFFRLLDKAESEHPIQRSLRSIENQLLLLNDESNRRFDQIDAALFNIHHQLAQKIEAVASTLDTYVTGNAVISTPNQSQAWTSVIGAENKVAPKNVASKAKSAQVVHSLLGPESLENSFSADAIGRVVTLIKNRGEQI